VGNLVLLHFAEGVAEFPQYLLLSLWGRKDESDQRYETNIFRRKGIELGLALLNRTSARFNERLHPRLNQNFQSFFGDLLFRSSRFQQRPDLFVVKVMHSAHLCVRKLTARL
jgi:hypothetical protein